MVTAAQQKAADDKAAAAKDDDKKDDDYVTPTAVEQPAVPQHGTVTAPDGVDRIVFVGVQDGWEPAPVNASDEDIERAKKREQDEDDRREALKEGRVDPVSGQVLDKKAWGERQKELKADEKANA